MGHRDKDIEHCGTGPQEDREPVRYSAMLPTLRPLAVLLAAGALCACSATVTPPAATTTTATTSADPKAMALMEALSASSSATLRSLSSSKATQLAAAACAGTANAGQLALDTMVIQGELAMSTADITTFVDVARSTYC